MAVVGLIADVPDLAALDDSIAVVALIAVTVVEVNVFVVEAGSVVFALDTVAKWAVGYAGVALVFDVAFDALADEFVSADARAAFGVVLAVGVIFATEAGPAGVAVADVAHVADAQQLVGDRLDAMRVDPAGTGRPGAFYALVRVTHVPLRTLAVARVFISLGKRADSVWWAIGIQFAFN